LKSRNVAETHLKLRHADCPQILINADYFAIKGTNTHWLGTNAAQLDDVLVHEMTHVAESYGRLKAGSYWGEGLADYVRYRLGYTTESDRPLCSIDFPHYGAGYCCAGAFLLFLDHNYDTDIGRKLNQVLRQHSYADEFFYKVTGRTLNELWAEFQRTPVFTADAKRVNRIQQRLGYVNGQPPKDIEARFDALVLRTRGGSNTVDALRFLRRESTKRSLPGFSKGERPFFLRGERGGGSFVVPQETNPDTFPLRRRLYCYQGDTEINYSVVRDSWTSGWRIERAWQDGENGKPLREFPITVK
jgi:hypothetical protein